MPFTAADLAAQEAWYAEAFGLTQAEERLEMPEAGVPTVVLSDPAGLRVEFIERSGSRPVSHTDAFAATAVRTFTHLALQVPDLDGAFARLTQDCGAAALSRPGPGASEGMRYAYVTDPEGSLLELIETA